MSNLEKMADFFAARVDKYDEHMLSEVEGCREGYAKMATLVPRTAKCLLDLGCGTGLELDEILKLMPDIEVTGVDLTREMLDRLKEKHPDKNINLICGDYFTVDFGTGKFDCAVSFQTMHHFAQKKSVSFIKKSLTLLRSAAYISSAIIWLKHRQSRIFILPNVRVCAASRIYPTASFAIMIRRAVLIIR